MGGIVNRDAGAYESNYLCICLKVSPRVKAASLTRTTELAFSAVNDTPMQSSVAGDPQRDEIM